jgi:hypothetical protein
VILLSTSGIIGFDFVIFTTIIGFDFSTYVQLIAFDFHKIIRIIAFVFHKNKFVLLAPRCAACGGLWKRKKRHEAFGFRWNPLEPTKMLMRFCCTR